MMICLILGAVMVLILGTTRQFKKRSEQKELKNKIKTIEAEKAETDINIKALELDKENLNKTNEELNKANEVLSVRISELENKIIEFEDKIKMQEEEVGNVGWFSKEDIEKLINDNKFLPPHIEFYRDCLNYLDK